MAELSLLWIFQLHLTASECKHDQHRGKLHMSLIVTLVLSHFSQSLSHRERKNRNFSKASNFAQTLRHTASCLKFIFNSTLKGILLIRKKKRSQCHTFGFCLHLMRFLLKKKKKSIPTCRKSLLPLRLKNNGKQQNNKNSHWVKVDRSQ